MSDNEELRRVKEGEERTIERILQQTGVNIPRFLRPDDELKILFKIKEELEQWNGEYEDRLHFLACTEICKQKMPEDYSLHRRLIHRIQHVKYPLDTSVISINPDYAKAEEITLRDPGYKPLAERLKQMLGVEKLREAYER